jgi:hypothetical protein
MPLEEPVTMTVLPATLNWSVGISLPTRGSEIKVRLPEDADRVSRGTV